MGAPIVETFQQDPDEKLDYGVDWSDRLPSGDTISSSAWVVPAGLTSSSEANDNTNTSLWLEGGTANNDYDIINRITTSGGRIFEASFRLSVRSTVQVAVSVGESLFPVVGLEANYVVYGSDDSALQASSGLTYVAGVGLTLSGELRFGSNNSIDSASSLSQMFAPDDATRPNHIGKVGGLPYDSGLVAHGWTADSGYVAGSADVASIHGGYDQICNSIASVIVNADHSMISYGVTGHSIIAGGSYNWLDGGSGRSSILGATESRGTGTGDYKLIAGGYANVIDATGSYDSIINGTGNTIDGSSANSVIVGGSGHTIASGQGAILGGAGGTVTSVGAAVVAGDGNSASGSYSVILGGVDNDDDGKRSVVLMGEDAVAIGPSSSYLSRGSLNEAGDAQAVTAAIGARTTNATITNMTGAGANIDLDDTKVTAGTGRLYIVGLLDGSADANNDSVYTQVAYELEFGFYWDGTDGFLFTTGTQTAVTPAPTLASVLISQTNNDFTAGAAPQIAISTGAFRIQVTGIASTVINWVGRLDLVMTRVS